MTQGKDKLRLKYTLGLIYCPETNEILLLNRYKSPWMGKWNGVGGKLDADETPLQCIVRETKEETGLDISTYKSRGVFTWKVKFTEGAPQHEPPVGGMYLFTAAVSKEVVDSYATPIKYCKEGVLDWKDMDWVMHPENYGVVDNIQKVLETLFEADENDLYTTRYDDITLLECKYHKGGNTDYPVF
ncbi:predicted protein [Scheffersomyces stipitis CBS 6054]|uniref:Nudix hydrolase domain-containing protein n=1 Tax=Scheffersomyces stipitis (strain ATCC 58785 / CBS 6054 / NBRC 10063 / NRRL Y-11545) TaxID=322104 RepID=A3LXF1_PICST|nr:predicted protein [Scheffersomyces stipitis CBS 6054]ABN67797.2 predicted protein [Scheffersomyces stipitis CBS 6054]KAG2732406.1 hypothetical protein G9P44_004823 [Scheffersomyces stipitis]